MSKITVILVSLTSLAVLSSAASAGETISDRRYWPNEIRADTMKSNLGYGTSPVYALDRPAMIGQKDVVARKPKSKTALTR